MNMMAIEQPKLAVRNPVGLPTRPWELGTSLKIEESMAYMSRHLNVPLSVATLAARADLSRSHFSALFKRHVGSTPIDYFIRLRLQQACQLLENTEMSVKAIAYTLGYDDPFYFSRIFKSFHRMPPSQYRLLKLRAKNLGKAWPARSKFPRSLPSGYKSRTATAPVRQPACK